MKRGIPVHPILLTVYPVLFLIAHNQGQVLLHTVVLPVMVLLVATLLLWAGLYAFLRDEQKTALMLSLFLLLFFSFGHVSNFLRGVMVDIVIGRLVIGPNKVLFPLWILLFAVVSYRVWIARGPLLRATGMANAVACVLVVLPLIELAMPHLRAGGPATEAEQQDALRGVMTLPSSTNTPANPLPDIYYIVLDAYPRADVLKDIHQFDNSDFIRSLTNRGFHVPPRTRSNYYGTHLCIASALNFAYLDMMSPDPQQNASNYSLVHKLTRDNRVSRFLKQHGYKTVAFPTGFSYTEVKSADHYLAPAWSLSVNEFHMELLNSTPILPFQEFFHRKNPWLKKVHKERVLHAFRELPRLSRLEGPLFVFAHIECPHSPFIFGPDGEDRSLRPGEWHDEVKAGYSAETFFTMDRETVARKARAYTEQVQFVNKTMLTVVEGILSNSATPPIIVIQGDHGSRSLVHWDDVSKSYFAEPFGILNAYYFPDRDYSRVHDSISPVNTFRVILNQFFGTTLSLLPDESFAMTTEHPFAFTNVTARLAEDSRSYGRQMAY